MQLNLENYANPVSHHQLEIALVDCIHPKQKIKYLTHVGKIEPIMRGWYLVNPQADNYSLLYSANVFYSPSYVSMYTALSYLGWIADRTFRYESVCLGRGKIIRNKIGEFTYTKQASETYFMGITTMQLSNNIEVQIASPTKALYDLIINESNLFFTGKKDLFQYLDEDLRFDTERLHELDLPLLRKLLQAGIKNKQINLLIKLIESL